MNKLIQLHPADNVFIVRVAVAAGEELLLGEQRIVIRDSLDIGHKIAAVNLAKGEKIVKFGVPVGSATMDIELGAHVHLHNMKSDYIPTYTHDHEYTQQS